MPQYRTIPELFFYLRSGVFQFQSAQNSNLNLEKLETEAAQQ